MDTVALVAGMILAVAWAAALSASLLVAGPQPGSPDGRQAPGRPPLVSVIVPMRNEAHNAGDCVRTVLGQDHDAFELIVVDDGSTDGTGRVVRAAAGGDHRVFVADGEPLPSHWVGKPWACQQGADYARGDWLLFLDADVRLHPAALRVTLADAAEHDARVVSWAGRQVLGSFWERVVNPAVLFFIAALTPMPLASRPRSRVVAVNGQFLAFARSAYEQLGGHARVHDALVEDLALGRAAKAAFGTGYRFAWARELLATRMYRTLAELRQGWSKNLALGAGAVGLPPPLMVGGLVTGGLGPWLGLAAWAGGVAAAWPFAVAAICQSAAMGVFGRRLCGLAPAWGLTAPLGMVMVSGIALESAWRVRAGTLRWRGRVYAARR
ncbi:MAG TPA: glycosyltransferase family 2 protein [Egibacteraceae bacterium]|nr:glycosyltransferase family 2 protein [Egibacteraceae bacterium]